MAEYSASARKLTVGSLGRAINSGLRNFYGSRNVSVTYAMVFAVIGFVAMYAVLKASVSPMVLPLAGGFMLVGPFLLLGYFRMADCLAQGDTPGWQDALAGFKDIPHGLYAVAAVCTLFYLIWITDAATLYGFMIGELPVPLTALLPPEISVVSFVAWSSLMGAVLAFVIFTSLGFAVPLIYYRRANLIGAVILSVRVVFANFGVSVLWALLLAIVVIGSILVLPVFLMAFPVMAYASHALYREAFPEA